MAKTVVAAFEAAAPWRRQAIALAWIVMGVAVPLGRHLLQGPSNNFDIFLTSVEHFYAQLSLYGPRLDEYIDEFLYGPVFPVLMTPFTWLPNSVAAAGFLSLSAAMLWLAIYLLPLDGTRKDAIAALCIFDFMGNQNHFQTNAMTAAAFLFAFAAIEQRRGGLAGSTVALGALVKVYGGAAAVLGAFAKPRARFILGALAIVILTNAVAAILTSPDYIIASYRDWLAALARKNAVNVAAHDFFQDQSVGGFIDRSFGRGLPRPALLTAALVLILLPYTRFRAFGDVRFRWLSVAVAMISVVIFSSGSETPTFILAQAGIALWAVAGTRLAVPVRIVVVSLAVAFSSLTPSDIYPNGLSDFFAQHSLRVLPCLLVWALAIGELLTGRFKPAA